MLVIELDIHALEQTGLLSVHLTTLAELWVIPVNAGMNCEASQFLYIRKG